MSSTPGALPLAGRAALVASSSAARWNDAKVFPATVLIVAALFLLLENPYWVPGGDSEVYTAVARSLASGDGYRFNGLPARIAPPGWPMLMAAVIKYVSPTFLALKLMTLASMLGALAVYYWILRRLAPPLLAAAAVLLTAVISHVYSLTFWLHSDALFTLLTAAMVLVALQINERRAWNISPVPEADSSPPSSNLSLQYATPEPPVRVDRWLVGRVMLLLLLCVLAAFVRWAALINLVLLSMVLLQHGAWRWHHRRGMIAWTALALVIVVTFGSFFAIRWGMKRFAPPRVAFEDTAQVDMAAVTSDTQAIESFKETQEPAIITGTRGHSTYATRVLGFGTWFSYLLWQPFRLAAGIPAIWWAATAVGWVVACVVIAACYPEFRAGHWLLPAALAYTAALCLNWPHATARYLVPIAPLLVLAIFRGLVILRHAAARPRARALVSALGYVGIGSVILCNLALYSVDVWVMRSSNFYDRYEAGLNKGLMAAAQYLSDQRVGHWQTCVNPEYINVHKRRMSPTGLRMLTMLTGKAALQLPRRYTEPPYKLPKDPEFRRKFISVNRVRYYLEQPRVSPWRVWHFRMGWLQERVTGVPAEDTGAGWRLYVCDGASMPVQVPLPANPKYPTRVPGF
jgi:hypothetical protein